MHRHAGHDGPDINRRACERTSCMGRQRRAGALMGKGQLRAAGAQEGDSRRECITAHGAVGTNYCNTGKCHARAPLDRILYKKPGPHRMVGHKARKRRDSRLITCAMTASSGQPRDRRALHMLA